MESKDLSGTFYRGCEWIMRFAYVNILFLAFTIFGLVIFGFMPATISLFTVMRRWIMGDTEFSVLKLFWQTFSQEFLKSNLFGLFFLGIAFALYVNINFWKSSADLVYQIMFYLSLGASLLLLITLVYFPPVYVHFKLKKIQYIKFALFFGASHISSNVLIITGLLLLTLFFNLLPGLVPLFLVSLLSLVFMWPTYQAFKKEENRYESKNISLELKNDFKTEAK